MTAREVCGTSGVLLASREAALWALIAAYLILVVAFAWNPTPFAQILAAIGLASALAHSALAYGLKSTLAFLAICLVISFTTENIGSSTGLLFGHYHFEVGAQLPRIGVITIIVGGVWFGMGYPLVAAFVMTQWDLVMDAPESTISKAWIWHDGGADFGVPLTNYFGWLLTSWMFYQLFALYLSRQRDRRPPRRNRALRLAAILIYAASGLTHLTPWLSGQKGDVADAAGHVWRIEDLRETTVAIMLFTMFFTSMLAALRLATDVKVHS
jgi:uncharacterized membrane protein